MIGARRRVFRRVTGCGFIAGIASWVGRIQWFLAAFGARDRLVLAICAGICR
jgi:hypothetical protein